MPSSSSPITGGAVGVAISALLLWALTPIPFLSELLDDTSGVSDIHLLLSARLVTVTASVPMIVGLISGLAPAMRAAQLDPIDSLRYE